MADNNRYGHNKKTKKKKAWDVKESKLHDDTDPKQRVDLRVDEFDRMIEQKGVNVKVYRTSYCPNVKSADGAEHEIDCQLCNGSGYLDRNPLCVKAYIQNQELEKMMSMIGQHDGNSVLMTFPIGVELQYFTRIELIDFTDIYFQRTMRATGTATDVLKYKACKVNMVVDKNGVEYFQDQDFKLDANGSVQWMGTLNVTDPLNPVFTGTRAPAANVVYTIHYECHVQFRAIKALHVNRFTQYKAPGEPKVEHIKMMEQWMCTKEFLLRRKDINTGNDLTEGPQSKHTNTTGDNT